MEYHDDDEMFSGDDYDDGSEFEYENEEQDNVKVE